MKRGGAGVGKIYKLGKDSIRYQVETPKDLKVVIDHFDKFPLITQKRADFDLFKQVVDLINHKKHLTQEGLQQIVNIRASINNGTSLKEAFPDTIPVQRSLITDQEIQDPNWLVGFTSGEGCFRIGFYKSKTRLGETVKLAFGLTQHIRDRALLKSLVKYFGPPIPLTPSPFPLLI